MYSGRPEGQLVEATNALFATATRSETTCSDLKHRRYQFPNSICNSDLWPNYAADIDNLVASSRPTGVSIQPETGALYFSPPPPPLSPLQSSKGQAEPPVRPALAEIYWEPECISRFANKHRKPVLPPGS
ncbi:unnamed protein product [Protopolystoma xenopodis]|uniref:Uncharacterized protein n=1 Tax=Protopolystoma xenopodis TaxID=117903 RepID=A0A448XP50_9PLAT|nr:unnamed protein product [Protopolystoma xenopodis]